MKEVSELQRRRAVNQIWNAAKDYSFVPDFKAYDGQGNADLYWNSIIGAVRRHYEYPKLAKVFAAFQEYEDGDEYEALLWLGLENAAYAREREDRPVLRTLREDYANRFLKEYGSKRLDDYHLYDYLATAHYLRALGREARLSRYDQKLLDELEFGQELDTDEIVERAQDLFQRWFQIKTEEHKRERGNWLSGLRRRGEKKGKGRLRKFGIGFADHPRHAYSGDDELLRREDQPITHLTAAQLRAFMAGKYGLSLYDEQQIMELERKLCSGNHAFCHLHITKGVPGKEKIQNGFEALRKDQERRQHEKNRAYYQAHLAENRITIARLASRIQNSVLLYLQPSLVPSEAGLLDGGRVWRAAVLQDGKIFQRTEQGNMGDLCVDILLDASTSQQTRQERVSTQGYLIAEALTRCGIPCRVMSFCSMTGYTILRVFRDYSEVQANPRIFEYVSNGCNRDGLAVRTVHELMMASPYEHKILILLSDVKPHDAVQIPADDEGEYIPYEKDAGVRDTAAEVRRARADGIAVVCVFTGEEQDLPSAKLVYNKDFSKIPSVDLLADTVGTLLQNQIRNL